MFDGYTLNTGTMMGISGTDLKIRCSMGCTLNTGTVMVISGTDLKNQMFDELYFEHWYNDGDLRYRYKKSDV